MLQNALTKIKRHFTLRRLNNLLTACIMVFGMYIILMPFVPFGAWWIVHEAPIISKPAYIAAPSSANEFPAKPTLVVPALAMKETVHEGNGEATLNLGTWHIPDTSSPDKGGNTVLAAHRHTRSGPGVFYHLDKLKPGDDIYMYWQQKRYHYAVQNISVVPSTQVSVEAPTSDARLTLYTCTPLWSFKDRLVVQATLKEFL